MNSACTPLVLTLRNVITKNKATCRDLARYIDAGRVIINAQSAALAIDDVRAIVVEFLAATKTASAVSLGPRLCAALALIFSSPARLPTLAQVSCVAPTTILLAIHPPIQPVSLPYRLCRHCGSFIAYSVRSALSIALFCVQYVSKLAEQQVRFVAVFILNKAAVRKDLLLFTEQIKEVTVSLCLALHWRSIKVHISEAAARAIHVPTVAVADVVVSAQAQVQEAVEAAHTKDGAAVMAPPSAPLRTLPEAPPEDDPTAAAPAPPFSAAPAPAAAAEEEEADVPLAPGMPEPREHGIDLAIVMDATNSMARWYVRACAR